MTVIYDHTPEEIGRPWAIESHSWEQVVRGLGGQYRAAHYADTTGDAVVFSGGYMGWAPIARRLGLLGRGHQRLFWGERLSQRKSLTLARQLYLRPFSAILAVGRWAQPGYRMAVAADVPVHTLPYVTEAPERGRRMNAEPTIGFAGSLIHRKGVDILLHAFATLPTSCRPVLEIAGSGPERKSLEYLADGLGLSPVWLGELHPDELAAARARWWAQAVPSRYDGWGMVVSEALAAGLPVLASSGTGAGVDLVRDGFNGRVVREEESWGAAIGDYCDADRVVREGANGRIVGEEIAAEKAAEWLEELLADAPSQPRCFVSEAWSRVEKRR